jgi:hypothetical protein
MRAVIEKISPIVAQKMLEKNTRNRPLSVGRYEKYAKAIKNGEWLMNGDAIRFSKTGVLLDGQHRLNAIIKSGATVESLVIYDLDDEVFKTIDQGAKRTSGDIFSMLGVKNGNAIGAVIYLLHKYINYGDPFAGTEKNPSNEQMLLIFNDNPDIEKYVTICTNNKKLKALLAPSRMAFSYYIFALHDSDKADDFFSYLAEPSSEINAPSILRERMISERMSKSKVNDQYMTMLMFKAFKLFIKGIVPKTLRVSEVGNNAEKDIFNLLN